MGDLKEIFAFFDLNRNMYINYDEFLLGIRGAMSQERRSLVDKVFMKLDEDLHGIIPVHLVKNQFNADMHPLVVRRERTSDQCLMEFLDVLEGYLVIKGINDNNITKEEFLELYSFLSSAYPDDNTFSKVITGTWELKNNSNELQSEFRKKNQPQKLEKVQDNSRKYDLRGNTESRNLERNNNNNNNENYSRSQRSEQNSRSYRSNLNSDRRSEQNSKYSVSNRENSDYQRSNRQVSQRDNLDSNQKVEPVSSRRNMESKVISMLNDLREKFVKWGVRSFVFLNKQFKIFDENHDGTLTFDQFTRSLKDYCISLPEEEVKVLFNYFDLSRKGKMVVDKFMNQFITPLSKEREELVIAVYRHLSQNYNGNLHINNLKQLFSTRGHPDVRTGLKTEDEVLGEFIETFDVSFFKTIKRLQRLFRRF